jgi:RimJ/RimL family protein N-acetyltransferase
VTSSMSRSTFPERPVTLETPRLILRQWQPSDHDEYLDLFADPEVARYIFLGRPVRREQLLEVSAGYLEQWRERGFGPFAVLDKTTGTWIGQLGLNHLAHWPGPDKVEIGWELQRASWGRGLATEGALAALGFGFRERRLPRIISTTASGNLASRRVMEKIGLTYQGTRIISGTEVAWYAIDLSAWTDQTTSSSGGRAVR